jgi:hypothetical protein
MRIKWGSLLNIDRWESAEMEKTKSDATFSGETAALSSHSGVADLPQSEEARMSAALDHSKQQAKLETIELGSFQLIDELNAPFVAARPKPRGLLQVPPEVEAAVAEGDCSLLTEHGIVPTSEDRKRQVNSLTLQYYYGGHDVAYRVTPAGVEVLAAGLAEIRQLLDGMNQKELHTIKIGQP